MGHSAPDQDAPYVERFSLAMLLPRYILIGNLTLIGVFGIVIVSVVGGTYYASPTSNPFTAYADVLPGQSLRALDAHGFACDYDYHRDATEMHCNLSPEIGAFSHVEAVYGSGVIHVVNFEIREAALNMGEIATWLDLSQIRSRGSVLFNWHGNVGIARRLLPYKPFSVLRRVWMFTLTDTPYEN